MTRAVWLSLVCCTLISAEAPEWQEVTQFKPWKIGVTHPHQWAGNNRKRALSCLGTSLELSMKGWPKLLRRPIPRRSVQRLSGRRRFDWQLNRSLGTVSIGNAPPRQVLLEETDWSHGVINYTSQEGKKLRVWMSRTSPAVLLYTDAEMINFFLGKDSRYSRSSARIRTMIGSR